ncbi:MAG: site-specific DNA-methyltransferase, partial [Desulfobacteraceae bacterium]|nr:site-specific DNA-methyltransferase [Desulfobacteraceae bacterium]
MKPYFETEFGKLYNHDCIEVAQTLEPDSLDLVIADPPYFFSMASDHTKKINPWMDLMNGASWYAEWFGLALKALKSNGALWSFCNWRTLPVIIRAAMKIDRKVESVLVWDKDRLGIGTLKGLR